tara:strand:- start:595 stop:4716 length:4122 start_codon:yes stop_codon:yes gene_type:complete
MEKVTFQKLDRINPLDTEGVASRTIQRKFGKNNDYVEFHIYDQNDKLLHTIEDYPDYEFPDGMDSTSDQLTNTLFVDPTRTLTELGFNSGVYSVILNFQRKKFFDTLNKSFSIKEISPSRTEISLSTSAASGKTLEDQYNAFSDDLLTSIIYRDFLLCFGDNQSFIGINAALDKSNPEEFYLLVKLFEPLSDSLKVGDTCRIAEEIINPVEFTIDLGSPERVNLTIPIKGPNFRIDSRLNNSVPSGWKVYDDFLEGVDSLTLHPLLAALSGNIEATIEYENTVNTDSGYHFENFVHFGSATERLKNFKYKLGLLELYSEQVEDINTITSSLSASAAVSGNKSLIQQKINNVIGGFDHYEKFLYFESGTYAWPKISDVGIGQMQVTGSISPPPAFFQVDAENCNDHLKPYTLEPISTSIAQIWLGSENDQSNHYGGQLLSASQYDNQNQHNLIYTVPEHIIMDSANDQYQVFINMIGHYFDQIWTYINHITKLRDAHNSLDRGISKDLVFTALSSLGLEAFDQFENEDLFSYLVGNNKNYFSGSGISYGQLTPPISQSMVSSSANLCFNGGSTMTKGDITKEVWKRLYHNLPYLLKTKGTERGIKALLACYGVPETILNVKEYGGPINFTPKIPLNFVDTSRAGFKPTSTDYEFSTFNYLKSGLAKEGDAGWIFELGLPLDSYKNHSTGSYFAKFPVYNYYHNNDVPDFIDEGNYDDINIAERDELLTFRVKPYRWSNNEEEQNTNNNDNPSYILALKSGSSNIVNYVNGDYMLLLHPHTGSDISSSLDSTDYGHLEFRYYSNGINSITSSLIPLFNGEFWNIHVAHFKSIDEGISGMLSESFDGHVSGQSTSYYQFGAFNTNFLGNTFQHRIPITASYHAASDFTSSYSDNNWSKTSPGDDFGIGSGSGADYSYLSHSISQSVDGNGETIDNLISSSITGKYISASNLYIGGFDYSNAWQLPGESWNYQKYRGFSGSVQEIKYHYGFIGLKSDIVHESAYDLNRDYFRNDIMSLEGAVGRLNQVLTLQSNDPFMYNGYEITSSYHSLKVRLPFGSNDMEDTSSFAPDVTNNGILVMSNLVSSSWVEVTETHRTPFPDSVGITMTSEKVRIDEGKVDQDILSFDIKSEESTLDRQPLDYNDLGIFFSPQQELNEDIVYTLGAIRMDDIIGDPRHETASSYTELTKLKNSYFKKYYNKHNLSQTTGSYSNSGSLVSGSGNNRLNIWDYIKTIQYIDHTLFKVIEQFVPAKANLKTGLLIEPHYLERTKFARSLPTFESIGPHSGLIPTPYNLPTQSYEIYECELNISDPEYDNIKILYSGSDSASLNVSKSKYDFDSTYITFDFAADPLYGNFIGGRTSSVYYNVVVGGTGNTPW